MLCDTPDMPEGFADKLQGGLPAVALSVHSALLSAYANMRPAWRPGLERHVFARYAGGIIVCGFAMLLLFMPRSGLSDALQLLGVFSAAWGIYQLLLPPCRE